MVLPHHKSDWSKLADEEALGRALGEMNVSAGQYMFPCYESSEEMKSEEFTKRMENGPWGTLAVWGGKPSMGANIFRTFLFYLLVSLFIAYLSTLGLSPGAGFRPVFRFVFAAGVMAHCLAFIPSAICFKTRILNNIIDGCVYALLTGVIFGMMWPGE